MSTGLDLLNEYGRTLVDACVKEVQQTRVTSFGVVNASGRLAASLAYTAQETPTGYRLQLTANAYVLTLIYGRNPGKFPPLKSIQQWIVDKGLVPHPDARGRAISTVPGPGGYSPLAFLIGRKIAERGNTVHIQGPPSPLFALSLGPVEVLAHIKTLFLPLLLRDAQNVLKPAA
jgi:hypothetical protein